MFIKNRRYNASTGERSDKGYGVIPHPGGDQTFIEFKDKLTSDTSDSEWAGETQGFFLKGTGKFENIRARWKSKDNAAKMMLGKYPKSSRSLPFLL